MVGYPNTGFLAAMLFHFARILIYRISTILCVLGLAAFLIYDIWDDLEKWVPLGGLAMFVFVSVLFSENPSKVRDC